MESKEGEAAFFPAKGERNLPSEWTTQSHDSSHQLANRPFLGEIHRKTRVILKVKCLIKI